MTDPVIPVEAAEVAARTWLQAAKRWLMLLAVALLFAAGFGAAWMLYRPRPAAPVTAAPEVRQKDGSLVLARQPATLESAKAAVSSLPLIPAGATVEQVTEAVLAPKQPSSQGSLDNSVPRPRIRVDLAQLRMPDGSERVAVSSPDADIVGGTQLVIAQPVHQERGWGVGGFWNPSTHAWGPKVEKDWGPLRFGATGRVERIQVPGLGAISNNGVDLSVVVHF